MAEQIAAVVDPKAAPITPAAPVPDPAIVAPAAEAEKITSKQLAALATREARLVKREREIKQQESAYQQATAEYAKIKDALAKAGEDPTALLAAAGQDPVQYYRQLTKHFLGEKGKEPSDEVKAVLGEITALKGELAKRDEAAQQAQLESNKTYYKNFLGKMVTDGGEKYECVQAFGEDGLDLAWDLIETHYKQTGEVLTEEQSLGMVEEYYRDRTGKLKQSKYLQSLLAKAEQTTPEPNKPKAAPGLTTLANTQAAAPAKTVQRKLTDDERLEALIARLPG